jgi:hypothetical protein
VDGSDEKKFSLVGKNIENKKDMSKVRCFACHKIGNYASQCPNKKNKKSELELSASAEVAKFAEKYEREFSLMFGPLSSGGLVFKDIEVWFMDSGSSRHITRMRLMFLSVSDTGSHFHVKSGVCTMHVVKGVGCVRF